MKITTITIIITIIALLSIWRTAGNLKREMIGIRSAIIWIVLWFGIGFFALFPGLLDRAMRIAQMEVRMFFILVLAVFILFALVFNLSSQLDKMSWNLAKLTREISLLNYKIETIDKGEKAFEEGRSE